jgi:hypothetical protein
VLRKDEPAHSIRQTLRSAILFVLMPYFAILVQKAPAQAGDDPTSDQTWRAFDLFGQPLTDSAESVHSPSLFSEVPWTPSTSQTFLPAALAVKPEAMPKQRVEWNRLLRSSINYLGVMHSFRIATEKGTRDGLHNSVVGGYFKALGAMHGWSDGDGYYETT